MPSLSDQEWITQLSVHDPAALEELRVRLARGLTYALATRIAPEQLDDAVQDFAQEAVLRVLANLASFRGESRFLTWANKVAVRLAFSELRRKRWQDVSLEALSSDPEEGLEEANTALSDPAPSPEIQTDVKTMMELLQRIINEELTAHQRGALRAVIDLGLPLEEAARKLGTNRNAFYKLLHDTRLRLQRRLARHGLTPQDFFDALAQN